jgi:hypothetical protein
MGRLPILVALAALAAAPVAAQTGNLVPGQLDDVGSIAAWQVGNPVTSSASFSALDADGCAGSGSLRADFDTPVDFATADYSVCLATVVPGAGYAIAADFLFDTNAYAARANLSLSFYGGADCTGDYLNGLFAGYAQSAVAGWQHVESGPVTADAAAQSALMSIMLTQIVGADPAIHALADNVRVTAAEWVFAESFEVGEACRWSSVAP